MHKAKRWLMVAMLASLLQVTIYCDEDVWEDILDNFDVRIYHDDWDCGGHYYWSDCDGGDDWWFDFDWW